jgi:hypothetical protein
LRTETGVAKLDFDVYFFSFPSEFGGVVGHRKRGVCE